MGGIANQSVWICYIRNEELVVTHELISGTLILGELVGVLRTSFLEGRILGSLECHYWENEV